MAGAGYKVKQQLMWVIAVSRIYKNVMAKNNVNRFTSFEIVNG